jgi:hypothetical protein
MAVSVEGLVIRASILNSFTLLLHFNFAAPHRISHRNDIITLQDNEHHHRSIISLRDTISQLQKFTYTVYTTTTNPVRAP